MADPLDILNAEDIHHTPIYDPRSKPLPVPSAGIFDPPNVCVQINREWLPFLTGVIDRLAYEDVWQGDETETRFALQQIDELLIALAEGNCMPQLQIRALGCGLQYSTDGGLTWTTVEFNCTGSVPEVNVWIELNYSKVQHYINIYNSIGISAMFTINFPSGQTSTGDDALAVCESALHFVASWCMYKDAELARAQLFGGAALALFAILTGGIGVMVGLAVGGAALVGGWSLAVARTAMADEEAQRKVACHLKDELNSRALTATNWRIAWQSTTGFTAGSNEQIIWDFMSDLYDDTTPEARMGLRALLEGAELALQRPGSPICHCDDWCNELIPDSAGSGSYVTLYGTPVTTPVEGILGELEPTNQVTNWAQVRVDFGLPTYVTRIRMGVYYPDGNPEGRRSAIHSPSKGQSITGGYYFQVPNGAQGTIFWVDINDFVEDLIFTAATDNTRPVYLHWLQIEGWSPNPFGTDNCVEE